MKNSDKKLVLNKNIDIKYDVDVFVAGGGAAGVAAAVACARQGRTVFLAEATGCFGGLGTSGLVPAFAPFDNGVDIVAAGIGYEIRKNVSKNQPLNAYWARINVEELKREYDRIVKEAGVQFSFFTTLCEVLTDNGHVEGVVLYAKSGMFGVKASVYIDCTGDGDLCAMAGANFEKGDSNGNVMPPTLCSLWSNLSPEEIKKNKCSQNAYIEQAYKDGVLTHEDRHLPGFFPHENGIGGGNIGHIFNVDPLDETSLTEAMIWGRKSMLEYEQYYKKYMHGYEKIYLCSTASILGVRESRRIVCDYMLNVQDFINRAIFDDEIGRYSYPIDIHVTNTSKDEYDRFLREYEKDYKYEKGESYGIPYRSLIPKKLNNVLVAGRCIGTDKPMQASIRVMPGCFITGQAAGVAAALACEKKNVRSVDFDQLQQNLKELGAYLPNRR